jgi:hypothetical protein
MQEHFYESGNCVQIICAILGVHPISIGLTYVRLTDNEKAGLRAVAENKSELHAGGVILPLKHGKDITFAQGTAITAFVNGDKRLTAANFSAAKDSSGPAPSNSTASAPHPKN